MPGDMIQPDHEWITIPEERINTIEPQVFCVRCGAQTPLSQANVRRGYHWCESCYEEYVMCAFCFSIFSLEDLNQDDLCPDCEENTFYCENCECLHHIDEWNEGDLCPDCVPIVIRNYHDHPDFDFYPSPVHSRFFGVELETDDYPPNSRDSAAEQIFDLSSHNMPFYLNSDCSLNYGFEVITMPCTLDFHTTVFNWDGLTKKLKSLGAHSFSTHTSALHIHVNQEAFGKKPSLPIFKLVNLWEKFYAPLTKLCRTTTYLRERSARRYGYILSDVERHQEYNSSRKKLNLLRDTGCRMQAINVNSSKPTIEFRAFRGTLNPDSIRASLELVDFTINLSKKLSYKAIDKLTWKEFTKVLLRKSYKYLPEYYDRVTYNCDRYEDE